MRTGDDIRPHTKLTTNDDGSVTALYTHGREYALCTGTNEDEALLFVLAKLTGVETDKTPRPWLQLCTPCNKRAAAIGDDVAERDGVEVCTSCAKAIDEWKEAYKRWQSEMKRKKRNKRKRERRRRR